MNGVPIIDIHTHLAGVGHGGTGCFIAPRKFDSLYFRGMCWLLGINGGDRRERFDQAYLERLDQHVQHAVDGNALDAIVVFAHDRVYNDSGRTRYGFLVHSPISDTYLLERNVVTECTRPYHRVSRS